MVKLIGRPLYTFEDITIKVQIKVLEVLIVIFHCKCIYEGTNLVLIRKRKIENLN